MSVEEDRLRVNLPGEMIVFSGDIVETSDGEKGNGMRVEYTISGMIDLPEGSTFAKSEETLEAAAGNVILLPDGSTISVHPVLVHNTGVDDDNHRNLTHKEALEMGVDLSLYDLETHEAIFEHHDEDGQELSDNQGVES